MVAHISLERNVPDIPRISTITHGLGVPYEIVKVLWRPHKVNDVLVPIGKAIFCRLGHTAFFGPDNAVSHNPAVIDSGSLQSARNAGQGPRIIRIAYIYEN